MKDQTVIVERKESIAFDNHQLHVSGEGCHGIIQLTNSKEWEKVKQGDTLHISVTKSKKSAQRKPQRKMRRKLLKVK